MLKSKYQITDEEREFLIKYIAERYRNFVFIEAENIVRKEFEYLFKKIDLVNSDTLKLKFTLIQTVADILEGLGRLRK